MPTGIPNNGINTSWFTKGHKTSEEIRHKISISQKRLRKLALKGRNCNFRNNSILDVY